MFPQNVSTKNRTLVTYLWKHYNWAGNISLVRELQDGILLWRFYCIHWYSNGSFAELVKTNPDAVVRIDSPHQVVAIDIREPEFHQSVILVRADLQIPTMLRHYVSLETALTEIRECFEQTPLIEQLSDTLRTTKIEDITELTDNGMGMNVSIKSRVTNGKQADSTVFNLELTPIRTFYEVVAVPGIFTMRWKREGAEIKVRLIEQMAHRWRYDQMEKIAAFLKDSLPDVTILM